MSSPSLAELGENAVLHRLLRRLPGNSDLLIGAGDDCAVVARDERWDTLLKADAVVEGVHFTRGTEPQRIGHKALARAVSDIAAMGGIPEHALITLLVHPQRPLELLEGIYEGMAALAQRYGISLAGGESSSLPEDGLAISVALTGRTERGKAVLRSGGRPGDILAVSGQLGGSYASGRHLDFLPCIELARAFLEADAAPRAMMDLSDGLACDLPRLAAASGCGYRICEAALPCHEGCTPDEALRDGEDYELLMAFEPQSWQRVQRMVLPRPLTAIGRLCPGNGQKLEGGWQHFCA